MAIHLACFTYDVIFAGCSPKIRRNARQWELMPIHLAQIMLFPYFCVAHKNSEFFYYIFLHISFDFLRWNHSMYESYANCEMRYTKNLWKQVYTLLLYRIIALCDTQKCVLHIKCIEGLTLSTLPNVERFPHFFCFFLHLSLDLHKDVRNCFHKISDNSRSIWCKVNVPIIAQ